MAMVEIAGIVGIGLTMGILSGILGIGGGVVLVPMLVFFLGTAQHLAQGLSLLVIIPTSIAGLVTMHKNKLLDLKTSGWIAGGSIVGAFITSNLVQYVDGNSLKKIFGVFVIYAGGRMIFPKNKK
jgi:uncharacterized membrane protein YfcA